jgi:hypothetical protein
LASYDEVLYDTLLADLQGQITYGAVWAIQSRLGHEGHLKWSAKVRGFSEKWK